jgi:hypothetical protein
MGLPDYSKFRQSFVKVTTQFAKSARNLSEFAPFGHTNADTSTTRRDRRATLVFEDRRRTRVEHAESATWNESRWPIHSAVLLWAPAAPGDCHPGAGSEGEEAGRTCDW